MSREHPIRLQYQHAHQASNPDEPINIYAYAYYDSDYDIVRIHAQVGADRKTTSQVGIDLAELLKAVPIEELRRHYQKAEGINAVKDAELNKELANAIKERFGVE